MKKLLIILAFMPLIVFSQYPCVTFDGINNYITIENDTALSFGNGVSDESFFISTDIYMLDATEFRYFAKTASTTLEYILFFNSADKLVFLLYSEGSLTTYIGALSDVAYTSLENQWINIIASYDGSGLSSGINMYIDGSAIAITPISSGVYVAMKNTDSDLSIGRERANRAEGYISNVRICSGTPSPGDLTTLQTPSLKTGKELFWWPLTEGYTDVVHNVLERDYVGISINDVSGVLWNNTQPNLDYNNIYGYTRVILNTDTTIIPYLYDSVRYFQNIDYVTLNGQSNMMGRAELDSLSSIDSALYWKKFARSYICDTVNEVYNRLDAGVNNYYDATAIVDGFGPELSLAYNHELNSSDRLFMYKYGEKNTSLDTNSFSNDWYPTSNELFSGSLTNLKECISISPKWGINPLLKTYVWMQGEADALDLGRANHYADNLDYFFDSITSNLGLSFNKTIGRVSNSPVYTFGSTVRTAQDNYVSVGANNATLINTDTISRKTDNVHYNAIGQLSFGELIYDDISEKNKISLYNIVSDNYSIYDTDTLFIPIDNYINDTVMQTWSVRFNDAIYNYTGSVDTIEFGIDPFRTWWIKTNTFIRAVPTTTNDTIISNDYIDPDTFEQIRTKFNNAVNAANN